MTKAFLLGFIAGANGLANCPYKWNDADECDSHTQWSMGHSEATQPKENPMQDILKMVE